MKTHWRGKPRAVRGLTKLLRGSHQVARHTRAESTQRTPALGQQSLLLATADWVHLTWPTACTCALKSGHQLHSTVQLRRDLLTRVYRLCDNASDTALYSHSCSDRHPVSWVLTATFEGRSTAIPLSLRGNVWCAQRIWWSLDVHCVTTLCSLYFYEKLQAW